ncbi:hypothetical protein M3Y98_00679500 [Aphelenchoides besseyi]|nr:hypothetical protein M3Y98_00679500 [Aphelenchoides besseyi]
MKLSGCFLCLCCYLAFNFFCFSNAAFQPWCPNFVGVPIRNLSSTTGTYKNPWTTANLQFCPCEPLKDRDFVISHVNNPELNRFQDAIYFVGTDNPKERLKSIIITTKLNMSQHFYASPIDFKSSNCYDEMGYMARPLPYHSETCMSLIMFNGEYAAWTSGYQLWNRIEMDQWLYTLLTNTHMNKDVQQVQSFHIFLPKVFYKLCCCYRSAASEDCRVDNNEFLHKDNNMDDVYRSELSIFAGGLKTVELNLNDSTPLNHVFSEVLKSKSAGDPFHNDWRYYHHAMLQNSTQIVIGCFPDPLSCPNKQPDTANAEIVCICQKNYCNVDKFTVELQKYVSNDHVRILLFQSIGCLALRYWWYIRKCIQFVHGSLLLLFHGHTNLFAVNEFVYLLPTINAHFFEEENVNEFIESKDGDVWWDVFEFFEDFEAKCPFGHNDSKLRSVIIATCEPSESQYKTQEHCLGTSHFDWCKNENKLREHMRSQETREKVMNIKCREFNATVTSTSEYYQVVGNSTSNTPIETGNCFIQVDVLSNENKLIIKAGSIKLSEVQENMIECAKYHKECEMTKTNSSCFVCCAMNTTKLSTLVFECMNNLFLPSNSTEIVPFLPSVVDCASSSTEHQLSCLKRSQELSCYSTNDFSLYDKPLNLPESCHQNEIICSHLSESNLHETQRNLNGSSCYLLDAQSEKRLELEDHFVFADWTEVSIMNFSILALLVEILCLAVEADIPEKMKAEVDKQIEKLGGKARAKGYDFDPETLREYLKKHMDSDGNVDYSGQTISLDSAMDLANTAVDTGFDTEETDKASIEKQVKKLSSVLKKKIRVSSFFHHPVHILVFRPHFNATFFKWIEIRKRRNFFINKDTAKRTIRFGKKGQLTVLIICFPGLLAPSAFFMFLFVFAVPTMFLCCKDRKTK